MAEQTIRTWFSAGEPIGAHVIADYQWLHQNRQNLYEQYGEQVVLIYQQQVLGIGQTQDEAIADAESKLPADFEGELTPITGYLYNTQEAWLAGGLWLVQRVNG